MITPTIKANGKVFKIKTGELVRYDTDTAHHYWLNDRYLPSVSAILQQASPTPYGLKEFWQKNTKEDADAIFESAGEFGSGMHAAFEQLLKGGELNLLQDYPTVKEKRCLLSFVDWFKYYKPTGIESEQTVASDKFSYAGTLDFVGVINNERWLIDFKTSNALHLSHSLQVMAYKQAYEESYGIKIDRVGLLRLGTSHKGTTAVKEGKIKEVGAGWEFREVTNYGFDDFLNLYKTYLMLNGGTVKEPDEIAIYPETLKLLEEVKL